MGKENIKKQIEILLKKIQKEEDIDEEICNEYINDLEEIKEELDNSGYEWVNKLEEIDKLGGFFVTFSEEDIADTLDKVERQFEKILIKLGGNPEELGKNAPNQYTQIPAPININLNQSQQQHQYQSININLLVEEFEEELRKSKPDKSKLRSIIEKILKFGRDYAPIILELLLKYSRI